MADEKDKPPKVEVERVVPSDMLAPLPGNRTKFPREEMRLRYAKSNKSFMDFVKEDTCYSYPTMKKYADLDGWDEARSKFREERAIGVRGKMLEQSVKVETEIDAATHTAVLKLHEVVVDILKRYSDADRQAKETGGPPRTSLADMPKLRAAAEVLETTWKMARMTAHLTPEPIPSGLGMDANKLDPQERETLTQLMKKMAIGTKH